MEFNQGDKVRVILADTADTGRVGRITEGGGGAYLVLLAGDETTSGWYGSELELWDEKREALIGLAETLTTTLLTENVMDNPASLSDVYENIARALVETLCVLTNRVEVSDIYDRILCGYSVRMALAAAVK